MQSDMSSQNLEYYYTVPAAALAGLALYLVVWLVLVPRIKDQLPSRIENNDPIVIVSLCL
jgi:hypothetical protein